MAIKSFKHKGIRLFFLKGNASGVMPEHIKRLRTRLAVLNSADSIDDIDLPGYRLHPLEGNLSGKWAINVSGNWRLFFEFINGDVHVLDYGDYH